MLEGATQITYRGALKSCNYKCSYCPFAKNIATIEERKIDEDSWHEFCNKIKGTSFEEPISILIAPYGEALLHKYYTQGIGELTKLKQVHKIGCQTNLSWDVKAWILLLEKEAADLSKITLWCTFHPEMTGLNEFVDKVKYLSTKINLSVGGVGNPKEINSMQELRDALPVEIYLWINSMDGLKRKYTEEEIEKFKAIDPLFELEMNHYLHERTCLSGEKHFFVKSNGDVHLCNRMPKLLGNLYHKTPLVQKINCSKKRCDCYLAYSHLANLKKLNFFGGQELVRVPRRLEIKAIFLDVDGTLLNKEGKIENRTKQALEYLSTKTTLYLATELPYEQAIRKCHGIKKLLAGGCFANGAHLLEEKTHYEKYHYLAPIPTLEQVRGINVYKYEGKPYKMWISRKLDKTLQHMLLETGDYQVTQQREKTSIVAKGVSKLEGVTTLCKILKLNREEVMVIGNSCNDLAMISNFHYSIAVSKSLIALKQQARYTLEVHQLPYII